MPAESTRLINVRRFFQSIWASPVNIPIELLSPDVRYSVPGHGAMSGVFHGPSEVRDHLSKLYEFSHGTFDVLKWVDWLEGDTHVVALQYGQAQHQKTIYRGHQVFLVECDENDLLSDI